MKARRVFLRLALVGFSVLSSLLALELAARWLDGYPVLVTRLPAGIPLSALDAARQAAAPRAPLASEAAKLRLDAEADPAWIENEPARAANRGPVAPDLLERRQRLTDPRVDEFDLYNVWNRTVAEEQGCSTKSLLSRLPMPLDVFDPVEPGGRPTYRYYPSRTTPLGLVTNSFGFRGPDVPLNKPAGTVRIAFLGASTTVGSYDAPFSYPDYVVHWLNLWAAKTKSPVRFDFVNAGRTGMTSGNIAAIARQEVLPLEPDLLVYYEGSNQFIFADNLAGDSFPALGRPESQWDSLVRRLQPYSALVGRVSRGLQSFGGAAPEPRKPDYTLRWPEGVDRRKPDIERKDLPLDLANIVADLRSIRAAASAEGTELAVASFVMLVRDGLRVTMARRGFVYDWLNERCWPYTYRDLRMLADFQNEVLAGLAKNDGLLFVDVAKHYPMEEEWFSDAIHFTRDGMRLQAWIVFQSLLPRIRERIASGAWPRPDRAALAAHPNLRGYEPLTLSCPPRK
jgi:hypothetical protein